MDGLTTGRVVHFNRGGELHISCRAAIITQVWTAEGMVNIYVFPDGMAEQGSVITSIPYDEGRTVMPNHRWHWPERA